MVGKGLEKVPGFLFSREERNSPFDGQHDEGEGRSDYLQPKGEKHELR